MNKLLQLTAIATLLAMAAVYLARTQPAPVAAGPLATAPASAAAFSAPANYIVHGVHLSPVPDPPSYATEITNFEDDIGKEVGIVMYFLPWSIACDNGYLPQNVGPNSRVIMLTWQPLTAGGGPGASDYDNILSGQYNAVIDACATQLKAWPNKTFLLRLMHEMNIADSTHWAGQPYNLKSDGTGDTEKFKQAWRYIWNRFAIKGVTNVQWVWSPNYVSNPLVAWNDLHHYYPGDQYVDWIGLSGYNWMGTIPFRSFHDLYDGVLTDLQCRYAKPIVLAEIGSAAYSDGQYSPPHKAAWITDAYQRLQTYPLVRAVVWFNDYAFHNVNAADFRVWRNTDFAYNGPTGPVDASYTSAYQSAVADNTYTPSFVSGDLLDPPTTRCPGDAVSGNGVLSAQPPSQMAGQTGATTATFNIGALGLGTNTTFTVTGCPPNAACEFESSGNASTSLQAPWDADTLVITTAGNTPPGTYTITITGGSPTIQVQVQVRVVAELSRQHVPLLNR